MNILYKHKSTRCILFSLGLMITINSYAQSNIVSEFVSEITNQKFDLAYQKFDKRIQSQIPQNQLSVIWQSVITQNGELDKYEFNCQELKDGFEIHYYTCHFKHQIIDLKLIFSREKDKVAGFFFVPVYSCSEETGYKLPSYFDKDRLVEKEIKIPSGGFELGATITYPTQASNAVCIFIHGSGPQDRDETIGDNKPFKDLAIGLANQGITTIRFDKRTYRPKMAIEEITVDKEVVEDVEAVIEYVKKAADLRNKDIYLVGHSLGGMLAPKLAQQNSRVKGIVFMAANASSLGNLMVSQSNYLAKLDGEISEQEKAELDQLKKQVDYLRDSLNEFSEQHKLPLNVPASYWVSLRDYHPGQVANELTIPMLCLQGGRDYQVTVTEFELWKDALKSHSNVDFKEYSKLNHLFLEGEGVPNPQEYQNHSHIPYVVIKDIGTWINKQK